MANRLVGTLDTGNTPDVEHSGHSRLRDYWRSKCVGDRLPGRLHIDPTDIPRELLSSICLVTVSRGEKASDLQYRFRLVGTKIVQTAGRDATGLTIEQAYPRPDDLAAQRRAYGHVVASASPYSDQYAMRIPGKEHILVSRLLLPLATDGTTVDMILGMAIYGFHTDIR